MEARWAVLLILALLGRCRGHIHWMVTENGKIEYQVIVNQIMLLRSMAVSSIYNIYALSLHAIIVFYLVIGRHAV